MGECGAANTHASTRMHKRRMARRAEGMTQAKPKGPFIDSKAGLVLLASACTLLWGSASPFIKLAYRLFDESSAASDVYKRQGRRWVLCRACRGEGPFAC